MKSFGELTKIEAKDLARGCVRGARSEQQIRERLTKAGFNGEIAAIDTMSDGTSFSATIMVYGPHGEVIAL